jgi:DNA modification methylase
MTLDITQGSIDESDLSGDRLQIIHLSLDWVIANRKKLPWLKNAKKHDIGGIWESITKYGFQDSAKWDRSLNGGNGGIVYGNGRHECLLSILIEARQKGEQPPKGIPIAASGDWAIPITVGVDQDSEAMAIALGIDHNNLTYSASDTGLTEMVAMWRQDELIALLSEIADENVMPVTLDEDALASLILGLEQAGGSIEEDEEDLEKLLDDAEGDGYEGRVKPGEIWQLGRHFIACGDCCDEGNLTKILQVSALAPQGAWTDPPYGVSYIGKTKDSMTIKNDSLSSSDLQLFLNSAFKAICFICNEDSPVYVAHPPGELHNVFYQALVNNGLVFKQTLVWVKNTFALGRSDYHYQHEPIYYAATPGKNPPSRMGGGSWYGQHNAVSVFFYDKPTANRLHPTMKPVALVSEMLKNSIAPHGCVFDPFLGSGTTLIAAEELGDRTAIGFELSEKYCSIICDRWEQLTGGTAEKVGDLSN